MSDLERLLAVQDHDLRLLQLHHRLDRLPERAALQAAEETRAEWERRHRDATATVATVAATLERAEGEAAEVTARAAKLERALYDGSVSDPGQLQDLQKELVAVRERQRALEDVVLEQMEAAEAAEGSVTEAEAALADSAVAVDGARTALAEAAAGVEAELAAESQQRATAAADVAPDLLASYDALRVRVTPAVARLEHGHCGGCHLELAATELDRLKRQGADARVHCEQCGCLVVPVGT